MALAACSLGVFSSAQTNYDFSKLQREKLGRGVVAVRENTQKVAVSWRYLSSDPMETAFNVYRNGKKIAQVPAGTGTFYTDNYSGNQKVVYTVKPVVNGKETSNEGTQKWELWCFFALCLNIRKILQERQKSGRTATEKEKSPYWLQGCNSKGGEVTVY